MYRITRVLLFLAIIMTYATVAYFLDVHNFLVFACWSLFGLTSRIREKYPLPLCNTTQPYFGPIAVNKTYIRLDRVERRFPDVEWGGRHTPSNCTSGHKVAIIVPFKWVMYRVLQKGVVMFKGVVVTIILNNFPEEDARPFNRGKLLNIGFVESQKLKLGGWDCFIMHDIDLLPMDLRISYSCPEQPRIMSAAFDRTGFTDGLVSMGGVSALRSEQFATVNGYSNRYWGRSVEDDDLYVRLKFMGYKIVRNPMSVKHYATPNYTKNTLYNPNKYRLAVTRKHFKDDGISSLKYKLIQVIETQLYTQITVDINSGYNKNWLS